MMNEKINELISLKKPIWDYTKNKVEEISNLIKNMEIDAKDIKIKYQDSFESETIINHKIENGKNILNLDMSIIIEKEHMFFHKPTTVRNVLFHIENIFQNEKIKVEGDLVKITFNPSKVSEDGEEIILKLDLSILFEIQNTILDWNSQIAKGNLYSSLDILKNFKQQNEELSKYNVKLVKSLLKSMNIPGIEPIVIINAEIKAKIAYGESSTYQHLIEK